MRIAREWLVRLPSAYLSSDLLRSRHAAFLAEQRTLRIFVDADACPVKDEVYRVAARYGASVAVVANAFLRVPRDPAIELVVVAEGPDVADDWIAERAGPGDVVVTADIPLADRALRAGAQAVSPTGRPFTASNIGGALAGRAVGEHLRSIGETTRGPAPFTPADRSRFLQALDAAMGRARRDAAGRP